MVPVFSTHPMSKFLRIERSLTSAENVVLAIVHRRPGATLLNCDEVHSIEVRAADLIAPGDEILGSEGEVLGYEPSVFTFGTHQGL